MGIKGSKIKDKLGHKTEKAVSKGILSIFMLGFILVFREGLETILFMLPLLFSEPINTALGITIGISASLMLSYTIFAVGMKLNLKTFFYITSILLIFVASGILGYGIHELIEYSEDLGIDLGILANPIYELSINEENLFHHKNVIGSILSVLFGYTTKMEVLRFVFQITYLLIGLALITRVYRK